MRALLDGIRTNQITKLVKDAPQESTVRVLGVPGVPNASLVCTVKARLQTPRTIVTHVCLERTKLEVGRRAAVFVRPVSSAKVVPRVKAALVLVHEAPGAPRAVRIVRNVVLGGSGIVSWSVRLRLIAPHATEGHSKMTRLPRSAKNALLVNTPLVKGIHRALVVAQGCSVVQVKATAQVVLPEPTPR